MAARALATLGKPALRHGGWQDSLLLAREQLESQRLFGLLPHLAHGRLGEPLASFRGLARSPIRAMAAALSGIRYTDGCCATAGCMGKPFFCWDGGLSPRGAVGSTRAALSPGTALQAGKALFVPMLADGGGG
jgi:hypothetical protein